MVKNSPSNAGDADWTPAQETKIPYVVGQLSPHGTTAEPTYHNKRSQGLQLRPNTVKYVTLYDIPSMWNLNGKDTDELTYKTERDSGNNSFKAERIVRDFEMTMYTLLYLKWITNKDLLHSTGDTAQCYMAAWMPEEFEGKWIDDYVWLSSFSVNLKLTIPQVKM